MDNLERWRVFEEAPSTNDTIHEAAQQGEPEGTAHIARSQSRGRGRIGREWWSPPGSGLYMSILLRPALRPQGAAGISLIAGRAVRDALQPLVAFSISLYWPNDLMVGRRKLGGILGELRSQGGNYWIALGIGVNIDLRGAEAPEPIRGLPISLAEGGCPETDRVALAMRIKRALWPLYRRFQEGEPLPGLVGDEIAHVGSAVTVRPAPEEAWPGVVIGLGEEGELLVRDASGAIRPVTAGEVLYEGVREA